MKRKTNKIISVLLAVAMTMILFQPLALISFAEIGDIPEMNSVNSSSRETSEFILKSNKNDSNEDIKITLSDKVVYLDKSENMSVSDFNYTYYSYYGGNGAWLTKFSQFVAGPLSPECLPDANGKVLQLIGNYSVDNPPPVNYNRYFTDFGQLDPNVIKPMEKKSTKSACTLVYKFDGMPLQTTGGDGATVYLHAYAEFGGTYNDTIVRWSSLYSLTPDDGPDGIPHFQLYVYDKAPLKAALDNAIKNLGNGAVNSDEFKTIIEEGKSIYAERAVTDAQVQEITDKLNNFVFQFTVDTAVAPVGTGSVASHLVSGQNISGNIYTDGSVVALTAIPSSDDYEFESWGDSSLGTDASVNVTVSGNGTYTANFKFVPANYDALNTAISRVPADLSIYTESSADAVNKALVAANVAVEANYGKSNQAAVDEAAQNLENAINSLVRLYKLEKYRSQVKFTGEKPIPDKNFSYRLTSVVSAKDITDMNSGSNSIVKLGFIAAETDVEGIESAKAAVESGTELPTAWHQASTDYISQAESDSPAYFGCRIINLSPDTNTKDIKCAAYIAYSDGKKVNYVWYSETTEAKIATNYDKAVEAWANS